MKKATEKTGEKGEMRPEYDFSKMKLVGRGIYAERYRSGTNIVLLDRDVRKAFPDDQEINETCGQSRKLDKKPRARRNLVHARHPARHARLNLNHEQSWNLPHPTEW